MEWLIAIVVGLVVGWISASTRDEARDRRTIVYDLAVGVLGAVIGRWLFVNVLGIGAAPESPTISALWAVLWGVVGAFALLAVLRGFRTGERR